MKKITVKAAAKLMNGTESWIRSLCSRGIIGDCYGDGLRKTYVVVPDKLANFLGISLDALYTRLNAQEKGGSDGIESC